MTKRGSDINATVRSSSEKRASEEGVTDIFVCEELGISARQLRRWRDEY